MTRLIMSLTTLLVATAVLLAGNGLQSVLVPVRAGIEGFSTLEIAALGSAYFTGVLLGSILVPYLVSSVGHIRTHSAMTALVCAVTLAYALFMDPVLWIILRVAYGVFLSGIYLVVESWLNERSGNEVRGSVLSLYTVINMVMMAAGQVLINLYDPAGLELFILSGLLVSLAAVPVALTRQASPRTVPPPKVGVSMLSALPRVAIIGALAGGLTTGAFWGLAPVFGTAVGLSVKEVSLFLAVTILGGALLQWPLGRLSDRVDRRRVVVVCLVGAAVAGTFLHLNAGRNETAVLLAVFFFGSFAFPLYVISAAHAIDWADADDLVKTGTAILFLTSVGALAGPLLAAGVIAVLDESALFLFTSLVHGGAGALVAYMIVSKPPIAQDEKVGFHLAPRTTPMAYELNPHAEDDHHPGGGSVQDVRETGAATWPPSDAAASQSPAATKVAGGAPS